MANVNIQNISELNNLVLDLKSKVTSSLTSDINTLTSILSNISNYSNNGFSANVGDLSSKFKINFDNILSNMTNAEENIFNYVSLINKFNVDDYDTSAKAIDLESQYNSLYLGASPVVDTNGNTTGFHTTSHSGTNIDDSDNNVTGSSLESYLDTIEGKVISVDSKLESSSIGISTINNTDANALSMINNLSYDKDGLALFNNRYVISTTPNFGNIGDLIDVRQNDGTILKCIIGNIEQANAPTINFLTNQYVDISTLHPNWLQSINSINNKGNYFDYINQLS